MESTEIESMKYLALAGNLTLDRLLANPEECAKGLQGAVEAAQGKAWARKLGPDAGATFVGLVQHACGAMSELGVPRPAAKAQVTSAERLPSAHPRPPLCTSIYLRADGTILVTRDMQKPGDVTKGPCAAWISGSKWTVSLTPTPEKAQGKA